MSNSKKLYIGAYVVLGVVETASVVSWVITGAPVAAILAVVVALGVLLTEIVQVAPQGK